MLRRLTIVLICWCCFNSSILNAQDGRITVTPLSEILGDAASENGLRTAVISPDGETIAWYERDDTLSICLYSLETAQKECYPDTSDSSWAPTSGLRWSPNSRYISFHPNFSQQFREPDIWVFDTENHQFTNYTDDGFSGGLTMLRGPEGKDPAHDILPVWNPQVENELYFFRITKGAEGFETALYLLNIESSEVQLVQDLSSILPLGISVYDAAGAEIQMLSGRAAISSDGTHMVFIVIHPDYEEPRNGIWLLDLTGETQPRQIGSLSLTDTGFPTWQDDTLQFPNGLGWLSNTTLVVSTLSNQVSNVGISGNIYIINIETEAITPLMDFSPYSRDQLYEPDETGYAPFMRIPTGSVLFADGTMFGLRLAGERQMLVSHFKNFEAPTMPTILYDNPFAEGTVFGMETASASSDGKAIIFGLLIELSN